MFWYCLIKIDKRRSRLEYEKSLLERISCNYFQVFVSVPTKEKEIFLDSFYDTIAQGVFYSMFFSYPKSRFRLNSEEFKSKLYELVSKTITGIAVKDQGFEKWVLELGDHNVLKGNSSVQNRSGTGEGGIGVRLKRQNIRTLQQMRYSPLVSRYLQSKRYEAINSVPAWNMRYTVRNIDKEREVEKKHFFYKKLAIDTERHAKEQDRQFQEINSKIDEEIKEDHREYRNFVTRINKRTKEIIKEGPAEYAKKLITLDALQFGDKKSSYIPLD